MHLDQLKNAVNSGELSQEELHHFVKWVMRKGMYPYVQSVSDFIQGQVEDLKREVEDSIRGVFELDDLGVYFTGECEDDRLKFRAFVSLRDGNPWSHDSWIKDIYTSEDLLDNLRDRMVGSLGWELTMSQGSIDIEDQILTWLGEERATSLLARKKELLDKGWKRVDHPTRIRERPREFSWEDASYWSSDTLEIREDE